MYDDEEEEGSGGNENLEENLRMKEKMRLLRTKMENLTVTKKVNSSKSILFYFLASNASKKLLTALCTLIVFILCFPAKEKIASSSIWSTEKSFTISSSSHLKCRKIQASHDAVHLGTKELSSSSGKSV